LTLNISSHRRFNPLTREWVLVSPQRLDRPWLGRVEAPAAAPAAAYDPQCYLCPGNARAGNARNPRYEGTFVFDNDFPALRPDAAGAPEDGHPLLMARAEPGVSRVVCFSARHDTSMPRLSVPEIRLVIDTWIDELRTLGSLPWVKHVQIFENRGAAMGASNPHPHGQIWANATVPELPRREGEAQAAHLAASGHCLLCEYAALEMARRDRLVCANAHWSAVVPFWAVWPFETLVLPSRHIGSMDELSDEERTSLAEMLKDVAWRYDALFDAPCPYSMGFHQRPADGGAHPAWHLHAHYFPPVLRSAAVHKFMVGYELLATPQRDLTPELAAAALRDAT
jgi:UDPglucose--hexose-1-phosphate uridylyltransferase